LGKTKGIEKKSKKKAPNVPCELVRNHPRPVQGGRGPPRGVDQESRSFRTVRRGKKPRKKARQSANCQVALQGKRGKKKKRRGCLWRRVPVGEKNRRSQPNLEGPPPGALETGEGKNQMLSSRLNDAGKNLPYRKGLMTREKKLKKQRNIPPREGKETKKGTD